MLLSGMAMSDNGQKLSTGGSSGFQEMPLRSKTSKGKRATPARRAGKDVVRFAPNFTAYVLPPDVVCLYSEDRKFFLHGELYCTLVSAIAKGGKGPKDMVCDV